jgi:hypothetical protein
VYAKPSGLANKIVYTSGDGSASGRLRGGARASDVFYRQEALRIVPPDGSVAAWWAE